MEWLCFLKHCLQLGRCQKQWKIGSDGTLSEESIFDSRMIQGVESKTFELGYPRELERRGNQLKRAG